MGWPVKEVADNISEETVRAEYKRLSEIKTNTLNVLSAIAQRESCIHSLMSILSKCPPSLLKGPAEATRRDHDPYVTLLSKAVQHLRRATVEVLENIKAWRTALATYKPFKWRGTVYVHKLQADTSFLTSHAVAARLLRPEVVKTPLLYAFNSSQSGNTAVAARTRRLLAARDILLYEGALVTPVDSPLEAPGLTVTSDKLSDKDMSIMPHEPSNEKDPDTCTPTDAPLTCEDLKLSISLDNVVVLSESHAASPEHPHPGSVREGLSPSPMCTLTVPLTSPATTEPEAHLSSIQLEEQSAEALETRDLFLEVDEAQGTPALAALCEDDAARRIQRAFRLYVDHRSTWGHTHEDTIKDAARAERDATQPFTPPGWQRLTVPQYRYLDTFTKQIEKEAAAALLQTTWRQMRESKFQTSVLRREKETKRAAEVLSYHWLKRSECIYEQGERDRVLLRYAARQQEEARLIHLYNHALATIQRSGRGMLMRVDCKRTSVTSRADDTARKALLLTKVARGMLGRRQAARWRATQQAQCEDRRLQCLKECKATVIQAWFRGVLGRSSAALTMKSRELDTEWFHSAAARRIQKAYIVSRCKAAVQQMRERRATSRADEYARQLEERSAERIQWWYIGRRAAKEVSRRLKARCRRRRDAVTKVGERYRGIKGNAKLATFPDEVGAAWERIHALDLSHGDGRPQSRMGFLASDTDNSTSGSDSDSCSTGSDTGEICVSSILAEGSSSSHKRALVTLMMALLAKGLPPLTRSLYDSVRGYATPCVSARGLCVPRLDLTCVKRYEEDVLHCVMNNMLRLSSEVLREVLHGVYSGDAPRIEDKWSMINVLGRIVLDWGLHAVVGHLEDIKLWKTNLLSIVLHELGLHSSEELLDLLRTDHLALLYSDKLSRPTLSAICANLPSHHEHMLLWIHEMGILQMLSTLPEPCVSSIALQLCVSAHPVDRSHTEAAISRVVVSSKSHC
eukprot:TRINITY_DN18887_c0_g1_i1.p1 TRINITY_DN18887_c0_g1~~TRINITY_DN18887_c0_g1_i1.p1  ORF type:complete len:984 (+),score=199.71 TRINITY_DN18887_c0_g1_i1:45-2954(+)